MRIRIRLGIGRLWMPIRMRQIRVTDSDPNVFGPPVAGSVISLYGSGSDPPPVPDPDPSTNKEKNEEKPLSLMFCDFFMTFYL
jgi:hypothetical protein